MEKNDPYICPKCGAIRVNWGRVIEKEDHVEVHGFCRQCETEFVVREEKK